jgi:hypothetical protein
MEQNDELREKELKNELSECNRKLHQLDDNILINKVTIILSQYALDVLKSNEYNTKLVAERIVRLLREFI